MRPGTIKNHRTAASEAGFTFLELLIYIVIGGFVLTIALMLLTGAFRNFAAVGELSDLHTRRSVLQQTLTADLETAGQNLIKRADEQYAGDLDISFFGHNDFSDTPGTVRRFNESDLSPYRSNISLSGNTGRIEFTAPDCDSLNAMVSLVGNSMIGGAGAETNEQRAIYFEGTRWFVFENGIAVASSQDSPAGDNQSGDRFVIQIEAPASLDSRMAAIYRVRGSERTLLFSGEQQLQSEYFNIQIPVMRAGNAFRSMRGAGVFVSAGRPVPQPALLPFVGEKRAEDFINQTNSKEFTVLGGDIDTDALRLKEPTAFFPNSTAAIRTVPLLRGSINSGDYLFLVDFINKRSVVCRVEAIYQGSGFQEYTVMPVTDLAQAAFGSLWSAEEDFYGYNFAPAASRLVKLAPPVAYRVAQTGDLSQIERRRGLGNWELVEVSVKTFEMLSFNLDNHPAYQVNAEIWAEGDQRFDQPTGNGAGGEGRATREIRFTVSPRAWNSGTSQVQ